MIRTTIASLALVSLLAAAPASAGPPREEAIGIGAGSVVGALAGGPVGFFIGAAIGAKLGDTLDRKSETIDSLTCCSRPTGTRSRRPPALASGSWGRGSPTWRRS
jgi:hypothetical protein